MSAAFKKFFGGADTAPQSSEDSDFADFAAAASPSPASIISSIASGAPDAAQTPVSIGQQVAYTKWYRVWERTKPSDFYTEMILLPFVLLAVLIHLWGTKTNKRKANAWINAHAPVLESEYAVVGFNKNGDNPPENILKEKTAQEFIGYATGRANAAFTDIKLQLHKRYNPLMFAVEWGFSQFFDSFAPPAERAMVETYVFDGKEKEYVPGSNPKGNSTYDAFVWAVVNKSNMRRLRNERYDVSLTQTKEHAKLPGWLTVMSESAEITDTMLTPELCSALEAAGDSLEYLIISDQPIDKPTKLDETAPKKRLLLSLRLESTSAKHPPTTLPLFSAFLRLPDFLVTTAHFRPEVSRKVKQTREIEQAKLKKISDAEAEEERKLAAEKLKKEERERKLRGMTAEEQRKFLDKENQRSKKKSEKRMTRKG